MTAEVQSLQAEETTFLVMRAGSERYAVASRLVRRIARDLTTYPVPGSDSRLVGLAQIGGDPLPVLDLEALVRGERAAERVLGVTVVVSTEPNGQGDLLGLAVDEALALVALSTPPEAPAPDLTVTGEVADTAWGPVRVVDPRALGWARDPGLRERGDPPATAKATTRQDDPEERQ